MSKINNFSKLAFEFTLAAEIQRRLMAHGSEIICEKNRAYYRTLLAYGNLLPWQEREYEYAASVVADELALLSDGFFNEWMPKYKFVHPFIKPADYNGDMRDIVIDADSDHDIGCLIDNFPQARLRSPLLYKPSLSDGYEIVDVGSEWFERNTTSKNYIKSLEDIKCLLSTLSGKKWNDAFLNSEEKYEKLYAPLLTALCEEINYQCNSSDGEKRIIKYLFGSNDYYLISLNSQAKRARIGVYELNGKLGFGKQYMESLLPQRIVHIGFKERANSIASSIINLGFNNGWEVNIRLKQTGSVVRPEGLRLEADFKGTSPHSLIQREACWR